MDEISYLEVSDIILALTGFIVCIYTWLTHKIWRSYLAHLNVLKQQAEPILAKVDDGGIGSGYDELYMEFLVVNAGARISSIYFTSSEKYKIELVDDDRNDTAIVWDTCQRGKIRIWLKGDLDLDTEIHPFEITINYTNAIGLRRSQELILHTRRPFLYPEDEPTGLASKMEWFFALRKRIFNSHETGVNKS